MIKMISALRFYYHWTKAEKAIKTNDKKSYDKHLLVVRDILWKIGRGSR